MPRLLNGCAASGWTWWCHASDLVLNQPHLFNNPVTGRTLWIRGCYQLSLLCIALSAVLHPVEKKKKGEKRLKKNYYVIFVNFVASLWLRKTLGKAEQEEARGNDFLEALAVATALFWLQPLVPEKGSGLGQSQHLWVRLCCWNADNKHSARWFLSSRDAAAAQELWPELFNVFFFLRYLVFIASQGNGKKACFYIFENSIQEVKYWYGISDLSEIFTGLRLWKQIIGL